MHSATSTTFCGQEYIIICSQMVVGGSRKRRWSGSMAYWSNLLGTSNHNFTYWWCKNTFLLLISHRYQHIYRLIASLINFFPLLLACRQLFSFQTILSLKHLGCKESFWAPHSSFTPLLRLYTLRLYTFYPLYLPRQLVLGKGMLNASKYT